MTASQVIAEIDALPPHERETVFHYVHDLEAAAIPDSFIRGMEEAGRGEAIEIREEQFQSPPAAV